MDVEMIRRHFRQQFEGMSFPASKHDLVTWMSQHGANNEQLDIIRKIPVDNFQSVDEVMSAASTMIKVG